MTEDDKKRLKELNAEADTITDGVLLRVSQSKYSWLILAVTHAVAFVAGLWLAWPKK